MKPSYKFFVASFILLVAYLVGVADGRRRQAPRPPDSFVVSGEGDRRTGELTRLRVVGGELSTNQEGTEADLTQSFKIQEDFANGTFVIFWVSKVPDDGLQ